MTDINYKTTEQYSKFKPDRCAGFPEMGIPGSKGDGRWSCAQESKNVLPADTRYRHRLQNSIRN